RMRFLDIMIHHAAPKPRLGIFQHGMTVMMLVRKTALLVIWAIHLPLLLLLEQLLRQGRYRILLERSPFNETLIVQNGVALILLAFVVAISVVAVVVVQVVVVIDGLCVI